MKKLNVFRLGLLFAGCFLGAGYVSGQELRQYFVVYGAKGFLGLLAAVAILYIFGVLCLRMAQRTGLTGADELVVPWRAPWLHALVMVLESLFLFALVTIMCAALEQLPERDYEKRSAPTFIISNTVKGKGVSFMEGNHKWHGGGIGDEDLKIALADVAKMRKA